MQQCHTLLRIRFQLLLLSFKVLIRQSREGRLLQILNKQESYLSLRSKYYTHLITVLFRLFLNSISFYLFYPPHIHEFQTPQAYNVIPSLVELKGTIRALSIAKLAELKEKVISICEHIAQAFDQTARVVYPSVSYPPTINDPSLFKWTSHVSSDIT